MKSKLRDYRGASRDYSHAIKLDPKSELAYESRGDVRSSLRDYRGASRDYSHAIKVHPTIYTFHRCVDSK